MPMRSGSLPEQVANSEERPQEDSALVVQQKQWRWLPFRSVRPPAWSPLQCLPAVTDLLRLSARRSDTRRLHDAKCPRAITSASDSSYEVTDEVSKHEDSEDIIDDNSPPVILDVGFARAELRKTQAWPKYELCIVAQEGFLTRDGAEALWEFLDFVMQLPGVTSSGFVLAYDLCSCSCPQMDLVSWIMHFISEPHREKEWHERCVCWKVVVPSGIYFKMVESALSFLFTVCPPRCRVFLVQDSNVTRMEEWVLYKPQDPTKTNMLSNISSGFAEKFLPASFSSPSFSSHAQGMPAAQTRVESPYSAVRATFQESASSEEANATHGTAQDQHAENVKNHDILVEGVVDCRNECTCADSLTLSFARVSQGFIQETQKGYLKIEGLQGAMSDEGLLQIMGFLDDFTNSANAQQGYSMIYDMRQLSMPSMSMVMRVAEWGKEPQRQAKWLKLNTSCKVVVKAGLRFTVCKGVLNSFFYMCPPVCRTFLLNDPDEPEEKAIVFEPTPIATSLNHVDEDAQSDQPENLSDDGNSSCGRCCNGSVTTTASACGEVEEEKKGELRGHGKEDTVLLFNACID